MDAIVVGTGPNGLAAAVELARSGYSVTAFEERDTVGGGARTAELTEPGFRHDICSAIHPLGIVSPFFRSLPLADHGVTWIYPPAALAHPLDDGQAAMLETSLDATAATLGRDGDAYRELMEPLVASWQSLMDELLAPPHLPRHPLLLARFAWRGVRSAVGLARSTFREAPARALFAGIAAHQIVPLEAPLTAAAGLVLAVPGHAAGWPLPRGGSQAISDALASLLRAHGGTIVTGRRIESVDELPAARVVLLDVTPRQLLRIAGHRFNERYRRKLARFRYGAGAYKIDYSLDGPIPWRAAECARAGTVHLGATLEEIAESERATAAGNFPEKPYVLVGQQSLFDPTRAPAGKHTAWVYCHVPSGSTADMTGPIEAQLERFAPGFREIVRERRVMSPPAFEAYNQSYIGGDIGGGAMDLRQLIARNTFRMVPYSTPDPTIFMCSQSTPPGPGVHGMCGYHAARAAIRYLKR